MSRSTLQSLVAGPAAAGALAIFVLMVGLMLGVVDRPHLLIPAAGLGAAGLAAHLAAGRLETKPYRIGAAAVTPLVAIYGAVSGFGALEVIVIASALSVALGGPGALTSLRHRIPRWLIGAGVVLLVVVLARIVIGGGELGHDESTYALKARTWLEGTPDSGWTIHRGLGQSVVAAAVLPFTQSATALRVVSTVVALVTVVMVWLLGRTIRSNRVGLLAAAVFAVAPSFLRRGPEFLSDVPSAALLVAVTILLWRWATSRVPRASLLMWATVLGAAAFYIRYQAVLSLALLTVGAVVIAPGRVRQEWRTVAGSAGIGLVLLLPHFVFSVLETGSPLGVIDFTRRAGRRAYLGEGLVDYAREFPDLLAGPVGAVAIVAAVVWAVWSVLRAETGRTAAVFLMIPAVGQTVVLGLLSHGEARFLFFPVALFAVGGAFAADEVRRSGHTVLYRTGVVTVVMALVISLGVNGDRVDANGETRAQSFIPLEAATDTIRADTEGDCQVFTGLQPQVTWYSGCVATAYERREVDLDLMPGADAYLLLTGLGVRQPEGDILDAYLEMTEGDPLTFDGSESSLGDIEVWRVRR